MSWRVILTDSVQPDIDRLTEEERLEFESMLFRWIETGPPRLAVRDLRGFRVFDERLKSGPVVTYFVDESVPYAAILRVRRPAG
ncbi:MAG: hypothetical protein ACYDD4_10675 [Acidimicrobiales bacterium]